jgi:hypothetical protein
MFFATKTSAQGVLEAVRICDQECQQVVAIRARAVVADGPSADDADSSGSGVGAVHHRVRPTPRLAT